MNNRNPNHEPVCSADTLYDLADCFGATIIDSHYFLIPPHAGKGCIQEMRIEEGLSLCAWDMTVHAPLQFYKSPLTTAGRRYFRLTYLLTPALYQAESKAFENELRPTASMQLLFEAAAHPMEIRLQPGAAVKVISLTIDSDWLLKTFGEGENEFTSFLQQLCQPSTPCNYHEPVPLQLQRLLQDFHDHFMLRPKELLYNKSRALTLLSDFLYDLSLRHPKETAQCIPLYEDKIRQAEAILREHIDAQLPCIRAIARQVTLSESTLKRYFHLIYRHSIYEYYMQLKMEHAKKLLVEKKIPVKEVAYMLGYEKSSSFIQMFKKHYFQSPGIFQRKKLA